MSFRIIASLILPCLVHALPTELGAQPSLGIPLLSITTASGADITTKESYVPAHVTIDSQGQAQSWRFAGRAEVRGRGNSTWLMAKKPYKLRLAEAHGLLGMAPDREWSLLANYADKTLMRNLLANHIGQTLGFDFTPRNQSVWLRLNGVDLGVYVLTEEITVSPNRLNLSTTDDTGGYLLEIDQRLSPPFFQTRRSIPYSFAAPKDPTEAQRAYISDYVQSAEDALNGPNFADPVAGYASFIDVPSFIDWFLVNEILKNSDASNFSSIYLHKNAGEKLKMGPLWDFDLAAGNLDYTDALLPEGWWIRTQSPWFARLFEDPTFEARVRARWGELRTLGLDEDGLVGFIDQTARALDYAQRLNFERWNILSTHVWPNPLVTGSYAGEVDYLKSWLITRMRWMDSQLRIDRDPKLANLPD